MILTIYCYNIVQSWQEFIILLYIWLIWYLNLCSFKLILENLAKNKKYQRFYIKRYYYMLITINFDWTTDLI